MAIIMGAARVASTVVSSPGIFVANVSGLTGATIDGRSFVYAANPGANTLTVFEVTADGTLQPVQALDEFADPSPNLRSVTQSLFVDTGAGRYLYTTGVVDGGVSAFAVAADGTLTAIQTLSGPATSLNESRGRAASVDVDGVTVIVAPGAAGVTALRVEDDGTLVVTDTVAQPVDQQRAVVAVEAGGRDFVAVASPAEDALSLYEVSSTGELTLATVVRDADNPVLELDGVVGLAAATVEGTDFVVAGGSVDDGLSVFRVEANGTLANTANVGDTATRQLDGVSSITTATLAGETFVIATAAGEGGVSIFHLDGDGILRDALAVPDTLGAALDDAQTATLIERDGRPFLVVSNPGDGLVVLELGGGDDLLVGTARADVLLGFGGADTLFGGGGADLLIGGIGNDTYVVDGMGDEVRELAGGGVDTVRAGLSFALGAELENLVLLAGATNGMGNAGANTIIGNVGANAIAGLGGNDVLLGGDGADEIAGGLGDDRLLGGRGLDILSGGLGRDLFQFVSTADSRVSAVGRDVIEDFARGQDRIDLRGIDANTGLAGDQAFVLDAGGNFGPGEIRQVLTEEGLVLYLNVNATAAAEMSLLLEGRSTLLAASDFLL